jgi:uncharacterized protein (TIGR02145 family)
MNPLLKKLQIQYENGANERVFSVLAAGFRDDDETYDNVGVFAYFWSSTEFAEPGSIYAYSMYTNESGSHRYFGEYWSKEYGFSVHCVKN